MKGLTYIREIFNMSMNDLAEKLGVTKQSISKWESGKVQVSEERLQQLEEFFKVPSNLFNKEEFTEEEILVIEEARFLKMLHSHTNKKFTSDFADRYISAISKPQELIYLLDCIEGIFTKLEDDEFVELVGLLSDVIGVVKEDTDHIYKLSNIVDLTYKNDFDDPDDIIPLDKMTNSQLLRRQIRRMLNDLHELEHPVDEED